MKSKELQILVSVLIGFFVVAPLFIILLKAVGFLVAFILVIIAVMVYEIYKGD